jgi:hypothetical protein
MSSAEPRTVNPTVRLGGDCSNRANLLNFGSQEAPDSAFVGTLFCDVSLERMSFDDKSANALAATNAFKPTF